MIAFLLAATAASGAMGGDVAFNQLIAGRDTAAIAVIEAQPAAAADPASLINLGIAYARQGDEAKARAAFQAAYDSRDRIELETATGAWVDSRTLARQALAMLDSGQFSRASLIARN